MRGGRVKRLTKQSLPNTKRAFLYRDCRVARSAFLAMTCRVYIQRVCPLPPLLLSDPPLLWACFISGSMVKLNSKKIFERARENFL
ncbi:MAG: hypothetical protein LBL66_00785 [Clostridiales bacterium]|nr:hypothetical protein [Clostridiales bacterium]